SRRPRSCALAPELSLKGHVSRGFLHGTTNQVGSQQKEDAKNARQGPDGALLPAVAQGPAPDEHGPEEEPGDVTEDRPPEGGRPRASELREEQSTRDDPEGQEGITEDQETKGEQVEGVERRHASW